MLRKAAARTLVVRAKSSLLSSSLSDIACITNENREDGTEYVMTPRGYEFLRAYALVNSLMDASPAK